MGKKHKDKNDDNSSSNNSPAAAQASGKGGRSGNGSSSKGASMPTSKGTPVDSGSATKRPASKSAGQELERVHVQHPGADRSALKELPALRDAPPAKREELFILKLKLCSVIFSFDDPMADKRGKDMKRQTLLELVDYVNTPAGQKNLHRVRHGRPDGHGLGECLPGPAARNRRL